MQCRCNECINPHSIKGSHSAVLYMQAECISTVSWVVSIIIGQASKHTLEPQAPWQCMYIHRKPLKCWSSMNSGRMLHQVQTQMVCWIICYGSLCTFMFMGCSPCPSHLLSSSLICWASLRWASLPMMDVHWDSEYVAAEQWNFRL